MAPPLPYADVIMLWGDVAGMAQEFALDQMAPGKFVPPENSLDKWKTVITKTHPLLQGAFGMAHNQDVFYGRELTGWNEVPPWFIEWDYLLTGGWYSDAILDVTPNLLGPDHQLRSAYRRSIEEGATYFYAKDGRAWWMTRNILHMIPGMGRNMDSVTSLDRANLGFVEGMVKLSRYKRQLAAEGTTIPYWMEDRPNPIYTDRADLNPDLMPAEQYERYTSEDTMGTRMGLEPWQEKLQAAGLRQYMVPTELSALDRHYRDQERLVKESMDNLTRYSGEIKLEQTGDKTEGLPVIELPDFLDDDHPLFDDDIESEDDTSDTGY